MSDRRVRGIIAILTITAAIPSGARVIHSAAYAQKTGNSPHITLAMQETYQYNNYWGAAFGITGSIICGVVTIPSGGTATIPCAIGVGL
jgi:hypothetical protein